jgi:hypothetical protein
VGVHASNVLASLPQLHFCMQELHWLSIYLACVCATRNFSGFSSILLITILLTAQHRQSRGNLYCGRHYRWRRNSRFAVSTLPGHDVQDKQL